MDNRNYRDSDETDPIQSDASWSGSQEYGHGPYDSPSRSQVYGGDTYYREQGHEQLQWNMPALPELAGAGAAGADTQLHELGLESAATEEPESPNRRKGIIWLISSLAGVLVIALVAWFVFFNNTTDAANNNLSSVSGNQRGPAATDSGGIAVPVVADPGETVREYLSFIESGDHAGAGAYVDPGSYLGGGDALVVDALASASSRISIVAVELIDEGDATASVRATMSLQGAQFEHVFALDLVDTTIDGEAKKTWSIREPLVASFDVWADGLPSVNVGDAEVALDTSSSAQKVYVYPGTYRVTPNTGEYFSATGGDQTVTVTTPATAAQSVSFSVAPNDAFQQEVLSQVQNRVDLCTQVPGNMDAECPSITQNTKLEVLTVTSMPSGFDSFSSTSFVSSRGEIGVVDSPTSSNQNPSQRTSSFNVYGDVTIVDGYPQVSNIRSY